MAGGVWNTLSFGPSPLDNRDIAEGIEDVEVDTNFGNYSIQGEQPRSAVGIIAETIWSCGGGRAQPRLQCRRHDAVPLVGTNALALPAAFFPTLSHLAQE